MASVSLLSVTEDLVSYTDADVDLKRIQTEVYRYKYRMRYRYGFEYRYWEKIETWKYALGDRREKYRYERTLMWK